MILESGIIRHIIKPIPQGAVVMRGLTFMFTHRRISRVPQHKKHINRRHIAQDVIHNDSILGRFGEQNLTIFGRFFSDARFVCRIAIDFKRATHQFKKQGRP